MTEFLSNTDIVVNSQEELDRVLDILYNPKPLAPDVIQRFKEAEKLNIKVDLYNREGWE